MLKTQERKRKSKMALRTSLTRKGELVKTYSWSAWHLNRLADAMEDEIPTDEFTSDTKVNWFPDEYVFKMGHKFTELETNIWIRGGDEGKYFTLEIKPGDVYHCWRDR